MAAMGESQGKAQPTCIWGRLLSGGLPLVGLSGGERFAHTGCLMRRPQVLRDCLPQEDAVAGGISLAQAERRSTCSVGGLALLMHA